MAVWGARMPAVQAAAQLTSGRLSLVLLAASASMVAGLRLSGRLAHRYGPARLLASPAAALGLSLAVLGLCRTLVTLTVAAMIFGLVQGLLIVPTNSSAVAVQDAYGRRIISGLHAAYSLGALADAALAAATARFLPHTPLFAGAGAVVAIAALATAPATRAVAELGGPAAASTTAASSHPTRTEQPRVWLLGAPTAACRLSEGAAGDWSAVHVRGLGAPASVAATAYALYCGAMAAGHLAGDRLTSRYGPADLVRAGSGLAAAGLGAGLALGTIPAALVGWSALGLGLSAVIRLSTVPLAPAVPAVATTGNVVVLAGPAAIGALASLRSLPAALALPVALTAAGAAAAHRALQPSR